ncbi:retrovirus-related pol polyprotein from transposon TNT 1-94 [Tanacetum coccineum]
MSQDVLLTVMNSTSLNNDFVNMGMKKYDSCEKCLNLDVELSKSKQAYDDLLKNHSQLEQHCISLKVLMQLKQEVFQNDESYVNQNAVEIQEYFEINDLNAWLQDKDTTICKLKDTIKSLRKHTNEEKVNHDKCELEPINKELENSVAKLLSENERVCNKINHVKQVFKDQFDSIKQTRVHHKEHCDSLINKLNLKSIENEDLKAQNQDKVFLITSLKNNLRKLKGKEIDENAVHLPSTTTIAPGMFKLELVPLPPRLFQNRLSRLYSAILTLDIQEQPDYKDYEKNTCFIRNLEGVDLLSGSRDTNLYTISIDDMLKSSSICLLSEASKTKSWLWHRQLSHLNFGTLNKLAKDGIARGIPRLKFQKDHLCSVCALGKSKKSSHQPKAEDTNQEKLYLLHMDLCGPMRVANINEKRNILVIVDDYSRFTWVRFLKTKDKAPAAIIKCIKNIQVRLKAIV